jgi:predicted AlkP superfamily phosphohydrolase/phosphomutase
MGPRIRTPAAVLLALLLALGPACREGAADAGSRKRVIVLGFDGMDYALVKKLMAEGRMPNFTRLSREGTFGALGTSIPPQSPVAWSTFITGMDAGGHGIFDFVHRDPKTMIPYLSTSRAEASNKSLKIGKWQFPLAPGKVELLRRGEPFWDVLERRGIETTVIRIPANFPPSGSATRELSGMGTPDILGTYGTFSYFTSVPDDFDPEKVTGGKIYGVEIRDGAVEGKLYGPDNPFLIKPEKVSTGFTVYVDSEKKVAKLVVGDEERVLQRGEWSDWVPIAFDLIPTRTLRAEARFYLKSLAPDFELYVSPLNIDPESPALPISTPGGYAAQLARATGRFYTQGMPEDTKSLTDGVLTTKEFLEQARIAGEENIAQYRYVLGQFHEGLLFYYFGNTDQVSHMMWRSMDPGHPAYDPATDAPFADVIPGIYEELDGLVGYTLARMKKDDTLVVMSDHGFTSWRRAFHLNTWLWKNGYLAVKDPNLKHDPGLFANVDWARTRAYGLGLNGLYINLSGRERFGIVPPEEREALMEEIAGRLLDARDPKTQQRAITKVFQREKAYRDRGALEIGPDLIIGYAKGTRNSNQSALGEIGPNVFTDNTSHWSGDHCMDPEAVPGILLTNRTLKRPVSSLRDLAAGILAEFGVEKFPPPAEVRAADSQPHATGGS